MHERKPEHHGYRTKKMYQQNIKFPKIGDKTPGLISVQPIAKNLKLQKISKKHNLALDDLAKINKIEKQFAIMTRRHKEETDQRDKDLHRQQTKDQMRQSKLLLLKDITKQPPKKKQNQNLLSNIVLYSQPEKTAKTVNIPSANISSPVKVRRNKSKERGIQQSSPTKQRDRQERKEQQKQRQKDHMNPPTQFKNAKELLKIDFVKLFIVQELLYYISKAKQKSKQEMSGFCKFYNENIDESAYLVIEKVLVRDQDFLQAVFYERLGFYIFLILGTDAAIQHESSFLLNSLTGYLHTNNLIILDLLMEIIDFEGFQISSQFHVYNTSRFNEARRKINNNNEDKINLLAKNNKHLIQIIKSLLRDCGFDSLKNFVFEILQNDQNEMSDKIKEVTLMLISLDSILVSSLQKEVQQLEKAKPKPPFLPLKQKAVKYTLVLDMDQTLIHYVQREDSNNVSSSFLVRPYCHQFLQEMAQKYELVIFTAAVKQYADSILDILDKKNLISHRLYRQHTRIQDYVSIKDLALINRDLSKSIIIDNIQSNFKMQPRNGIAITTWVGDPDDTSLYNLIPVLRKISNENVNDVRDALQALSKYMESKMELGEEVNLQKYSLKGL